MNAYPHGPDSDGADVGRVIDRVMLRLVKGGPEQAAIEAGEIDAILDADSGSAFLLPARSPARFARAATDADIDWRSLDALPARFAVVDADGLILFANAAWRAHAERTSGCSAGDNYLAACDGIGIEHGLARRVDGQTIAAGLRQVLAGKRARFQHELAVDESPRSCWLALAIVPVSGDPAHRAIVSMEDISERRRGELLRALEYTVARLTAESDSSSATLKAVIQAVCESQGWDCGRYFRLDAATSLLHFEESWGRPTADIERFLEASRGQVVQSDVGLTGRVCHYRQPLWVVNGQRDRAWSELGLAGETGLDGAMLFPVLLNDKTIGVLSFSGFSVLEPDERMLHAVRSIGDQLGRTLQRLQAAASVRRNEQRFRRLTELSSDWHWQQDQDFRFTEWIGSGFPGYDQALGRSHWELPGLVADDQAWLQHRMLLAQRWPFHDFVFTARHWDGTWHCYSVSGEPVFSEDLCFTGYQGVGIDLTAHQLAELARQDHKAA